MPCINTGKELFESEKCLVILQKLNKNPSNISQEYYKQAQVQVEV